MIFDNSEFYKIFSNSTGFSPEIVSSCDHIFSSPPLRLLDSHTQLSSMNSMILVADNTIPENKRYKAELILDSGIYAGNQVEFYLFKQDTPYCINTLLEPNFELQYKLLKKTLNGILGKKENIEIYLKRFNILTDLYRKVINESHQSSSLFYLNLIPELYVFLGLKELGESVKKRIISLYNSGIIDKYIPTIIERSLHEKYGILHLIESTEIFSLPYFRFTKREYEYENIDFCDKNTIKNNIFLILELLRTKKIIPCHEIFSWGLALAGIKHYGNDFLFFQNFHNVLISFEINNNVDKLQYTKPKEDGKNFIEFENSLVYHIEPNGFGFTKSTAKLSRATNIISVYLHIGDKLVDYYKNYIKTKNVEKIQMGHIL